MGLSIAMDRAYAYTLLVLPVGFNITLCPLRVGFIITQPSFTMEMVSCFRYYNTMDMGHQVIQPAATSSPSEIIFRPSAYRCSPICTLRSLSLRLRSLPRHSLGCKWGV